MNRKRLKPWHGILLIAICICILYFASPSLSAKFGLYGTLMGELLMLAAAFAVVIGFKGNLREVFPVRRIKPARFFGTLVLWTGSFLGIMAVTMILSYFLPQQVMGTSAGLQKTMLSVPFFVSILIVGVTPAICEEAVFRGVVLNSFRPFRYKWLIITVTGMIFGMFHGSLVRAIPTGMLGMVMAYILLETDNICYTSIFHFVNNAAPIVLLYALRGFYESPRTQSQMEQIAGQGMPLMSVGAYMIWASGVPLCLYIGNFLLHVGNPGYRREVFPKGDKKTVILLALMTLVIFLAGITLMGWAFMKEGQTLIQYY